MAWHLKEFLPFSGYLCWPFEFILDTLRKVEDEKTKQNLYEVFKKFVVKVEAKKTVNPYNLNDILNRFDQQTDYYSKSAIW